MTNTGTMLFPNGTCHVHNKIVNKLIDFIQDYRVSDSNWREERLHVITKENN